MPSLKSLKKNLFEMGSDFSDDWSSDNKDKPKKKIKTEIKLPEKHQLYLTKEKRRGKVITIIKPFCLSNNDLKSLLKTLKKKLGTGGTVKEDRLEFQGEVQEKLILELKKLNYKLK